MISLKFGTAILVSHRSALMLMERMTLTPLEVAQAVSLLGQVKSNFSICTIVLLLLSPHHPPSFQPHPPPSTQPSILLNFQRFSPHSTPPPTLHLIPHNFQPSFPPPRLRSQP